jgi:hypothetical protein
LKFAGKVGFVVGDFLLIVLEGVCKQEGSVNRAFAAALSDARVGDREGIGGSLLRRWRNFIANPLVRRRRGSKDELLLLFVGHFGVVHRAFGGARCGKYFV